jgi:hypothetical protein
MLHDPLPERSRSLVERDGVDPSFGSEMGECEHDADPRIVGEARQGLVAHDGQEGDVEIAVGPSRASGPRTEDQERGDPGDLLNGFTDAPEERLAHQLILRRRICGSSRRMAWAALAA